MREVLLYLVIALLLVISVVAVLAVLMEMFHAA